MKSSAASADVADLPVLKVLARARAEGRMPHAVLLTGNDGAVLARAAEQLAAMHLGEADPLAHPDCRVLRPAKKSRRIVIENTLEVVAALRLSSLTPRRVVIVNEPDRFLSESANAFLKTLEEPPPGTLIILQTTHYYRVLPTILSRCLRFHVGGEAPVIADPSWQDWLREMERLLTRMVKGPASPQARVSEVFIPLTRCAPASRCCSSSSSRKPWRPRRLRRPPTKTRMTPSSPTKSPSAAASAPACSSRSRKSSGSSAGPIPAAPGRSLRPSAISRTPAGAWS